MLRVPGSAAASAFIDGALSRFWAFKPHCIQQAADKTRRPGICNDERRYRKMPPLFISLPAFASRDDGSGLNRNTRLQG